MPMDDHDDFAFEPVRGLPEKPPKSEHILWQGSPSTLALARDAYGLNWIVGYFALIILWRATVGSLSGGWAGAFAFGLPYAILAGLAVVVVLALAWVAAKTTVYTITSARVAMRIGAALTVTLNIPFRQLGSAHLDLRSNGTGTIALETLGDTKFSYLMLWPHLRPWHARKPQPALRCIPDARRVAAILAEAAEAKVSEPVISRAAAPAPVLAAAE